MTRLTPREFRTRLIDLAARLRRELQHPSQSEDNAVTLMRECLELLDDLEEPLERFVMTSPGGMRTRG